ncbi:MAG: xanthine dehydrogenase family protein molybdopterin-binding subunit [Deltaproteobacteria bacterium]|nr:xanthine dehydrogenase family protein molybdopterin-binding subunit [Deltaproteobacteria bacterium]
MTSVVGEEVHRIDSEEKITGKGVYTGDIKLPGMLYGKVLRSPLPHARIRRIDARGAATLPGVLAVLTRDDLPMPSPLYGAYVKDQPIVAVEKVRYAGDVVAAVAATEERIAEEALQRVEVDYEELAAVVTVEEALQENAPLVHDNLQGRKEPRYGKGGAHIAHENSNICLHFRYQRGDGEQGLDQADFVFEDTFLFPSAQHYPLEPHISLANFDGDKLTVWSSTQSPFPLRQELARVFAIPVSRVRVIVPYIGGGYGAKSGIRTEALAVALSRLAGRPVRVAFSADDTFKTICQPRTKVKIKTGIKKDGTFVARRCEVYVNVGAYANSGPSVTEKAGYRAHGPYRIPHVLTDAFCVYTNTVPGGAFRGFGAPQVTFAYESHVDMIAHHLKMDPLELRMKNLLEKGEAYSAGDTPIDCDLKGGLRRVAEAIEWGKKDQGSEGSRVKRGKGLACGVKDGGGTNKPAHAMVKILGDGSILLSFASVEMGQGIRTALVQVVAQELQAPPEMIQVGELDTQYTPFDRGTNASSAMSIMGQAVLKAARNARGQLVSAAATLFGVDEGAVQLEKGKLFIKEKSLSFHDVMRLCFGQIEGEIVGRGYFFVGPSDQVPLGYPSPFWEIGLGGVEVEVDEMTGEVKILRYVSLTDAGKMIHPLLCRGQDEGAAMFGIGQSLFEDLIYRDGQLVNPNLVDYRLPRFRDLPPSFTTQIVEEGGGPGPYGAKGMGEGGILAVAPAVCNAVYDAIGVRIQEVPLKGERVWKAIMKGTVS